jgi:hypothetical protein
LKKKSKTNKAPYSEEDDSDFLNHATSSKNPIDVIYENPTNTDIYLANYNLTGDFIFTSCISRSRSNSYIGRPLILKLRLLIKRMAR